MNIELAFWNITRKLQRAKCLKIIKYIQQNNKKMWTINKEYKMEKLSSFHVNGNDENKRWTQFIQASPLNQRELSSVCISFLFLRFHPFPCFPWWEIGSHFEQILKLSRRKLQLLERAQGFVDRAYCLLTDLLTDLNFQHFQRNS